MPSATQFDPARFSAAIVKLNVNLGVESQSGGLAAGMGGVVRPILTDRGTGLVVLTAAEAAAASRDNAEDALAAAIETLRVKRGLGPL